MVEADRVRRWLYRGGRAGALARRLNFAQAWLAAAGIGPRWLVVLEVSGRRTGRTISLPVVVADYEGDRYLVSMLGEHASWVRNVRAADGRAVLRHRTRELVRLQEVGEDRRAGVLRCYLQRAPGARAHIPLDRHASLAAFEAIAGRYPVFLVRAEEVATGADAGSAREPAR